MFSVPPSESHAVWDMVNEHTYQSLLKLAGMRQEESLFAGGLMSVLYLTRGIHQMTQQETHNKDQTIKNY